MNSIASRLIRMDQRLRTASVRYGTTRAKLVLQLLEIYRRKSFRPGDALLLGMADPKVSAETLSGFIEKNELLEIQFRLNPRTHFCLVEDKSVFYPYCEALGIPVPRTFAIIARTGGWNRDGTRVASREDWKMHVVPALPQTFITKPAAGVYGEGVNAWTRVEGGFADHRQRVLSSDELHELLTADARYDRFVVQERLENHPKLVELTGTSSLQTVRISTLVDSANAARVLYAKYKLVIGNNISDNFEGGLSGNLTANIALVSGVLGPAKTFSPDGVGPKSFTEHPKTQRALEGFALPDWNELTQLATRCASLFLPLRTIGWDIALTPRGPVVVEGNATWDPPNDSVLGPGAPGVEKYEVIAGLALLREQV